MPPVEAEIPYDAIVTLLVFMVGIPAVVLQSLAPEVRLVVTHRWGRLVRDAGLPVAVSLAAIVLGMIAEANDWVRTEVVWGIVLGVLFGLVATTAFRIPRQYGRRDAVVDRLRDEVGETIAADGRLVESSLEDLIDLGRHSEEGGEKELVLEALLALTHDVCRHPNYDGDRLGDLVMGLVDMLPPADSRRSQTNFTTATAILRTIVTSYEAERGQELRQVDLSLAIRALSSIGRASLGLGTEAVAIAIVQALGATPKGRGETFVSQALFEVGLRSIEHGRILVAMAALAELMAIVEDDRPATGELVADTLGLLSHFWSHGDTGRGYARQRLEVVREALGADLDGALEAAARHCAMTTQFRTADRLQAMARDLAREKGA